MIETCPLCGYKTSRLIPTGVGPRCYHCCKFNARFLAKARKRRGYMRWKLKGVEDH